MTARSSLCSWVWGDAEESEGKAPAALNESRREGREEWNGGDQAGVAEQRAPSSGFLEDRVGGSPCWGERWAGEGGLHPVRMCKLVLAHGQGASTESCKPEAQGGFGMEELSRCQGAQFPKGELSAEAEMFLSLLRFPGEREGAPQLGWEEPSHFSKHHVRPDAGV